MDKFNHFCIIVFVILLPCFLYVFRVYRFFRRGYNKCRMTIQHGQPLEVMIADFRYSLWDGCLVKMTMKDTPYAVLNAKIPSFWMSLYTYDRATYADLDIGSTVIILHYNGCPSIMEKTLERTNDIALQRFIWKKAITNATIYRSYDSQFFGYEL